MSKSTKSARPAKPHPDFPLFAHSNGQWAKKIRGKLHYFGCWDDSQAALQKYVDEKDDLLAGRIPRAKRDGLTIRELSNRFLEAKAAARDSGEIAAVTWSDYYFACKRIVNVFGRDRLVEDLHGDDFDRLRSEVAKVGNLTTQANAINRTRIVFRYAYEAGLIEKPVRFGANFKRPNKKAIRRQRTPRMFEAEQIRIMLDRAQQPMRAMILLGVNCGFGNSDVGRLPESALDLTAGWVTFPRPKTGSERRCSLWPETIDAVTQALSQKPEPANSEFASLVFLTRFGKPWNKEGASYLSEQFRKFLQSIDAEAAQEVGDSEPARLYRKGVGFYTLRHVFETIGGESRDQVAVDAIMGHERGDMASHYRERISDERLQGVVEIVHDWLYTDHLLSQEPATVPFKVVG